MLLVADRVESWRRVDGVLNGDRGGREGIELLRRCVIGSSSDALIEGNGDDVSWLDPDGCCRGVGCKLLKVVEPVVASD